MCVRFNPKPLGATSGRHDFPGGDLPKTNRGLLKVCNGASMMLCVLQTSCACCHPPIRLSCFGLIDRTNRTTECTVGESPIHSFDDSGTDWKESDRKPKVEARFLCSVRPRPRTFEHQRVRIQPAEFGSHSSELGPFAMKATRRRHGVVKVNVEQWRTCNEGLHNWSGRKDLQSGPAHCQQVVRLGPVKGLPYSRFPRPTHPARVLD